MKFTCTRKLAINLFLFTTTLIVVLGTILVIWVMTGPRSVNYFTPYIESKLSSAATPYKVKIENSELDWDGFEHPVSLHIKNVGVLNEKGAVVAYFPEIGIKVYFLKLLYGVLDIKSFEISSPNLLLNQQDDGTVSFGTNNANNSITESPANIFSLFADDSNSSLHIKTVSINNASISINRKSRVLLQSTNSFVEISREHGKATGIIRMPIRAGIIIANFTLENATKSAIAEVTYKDIPASLIHELIPNQPYLNGISLSFSGKAKINSDFNFNIANIDFGVETSKGSIEIPEQLKQPVNFQTIKLAGKISDKLSKITFAPSEIVLTDKNSKNIELNFAGILEKVGDDYAIEANANTANLPIDDLDYYWITSLSPQSRKWVTSNISKGTVTDANVELHFKAGELKLKDTPEQAIAATLHIKNASVKYLPNHPIVTDINGIVKFTGKAMDAEITNAKYMSGSRITSASLKFPDMNAADVVAFIDMKVNAPAKDAAKFLALPDVNKAAKLGITDDINGEIIGNAKLNFVAFSDTDKPDATGDINYDINAELKGISQPKFMGKRDIEDANIQLALNNKGIKLNGTAKINTLPMQIDLTSDFFGIHNTIYTVDFNLPVEDAQKFELPKLDFMNGTIGINAKFIESDKIDTTNANLDLTNVAITFKEHDFYKKLGVKGKLDLEIVNLGDGNTLIKSFLLKTSDALLSGRAEFNKKMGDFSNAVFDKINYGKNDINRLEYQKNNAGIKLLATGNSFDVSPYLRDSKDNKSNKNLNLNIMVDKLVLGENRELQKVNLHADCATICKSASLTAKLANNSDFSYLISNGKVTANSNNAGELLKALGIIDTVEGGNLQLAGAYNGELIDGQVTMGDYTIKRAPILTKILTIASLTGIKDNLIGNGIYFSKFVSNFSYLHGLINVKETKAHGSALGITAEGTVDSNKSVIDLKGVLVPSYTINSLIGNVPLIGELLLGGTGKGIIAMNYSVSGNMADPSISVNPLSALTPGFMRNIFNIFDKEAPDLEKIAAENKAKKEKQ